MSAEALPVSLNPEVVNHDATAASDAYLQQAMPGSLSRWFGHGALTVGTEAFTAVGANLAPMALIYNRVKDSIDFASIASSLAASTPDLAHVPNLAVQLATSVSNMSLVGSAIGIGALAVGSTIGWQGAKFAGPIEKFAYVGIKLAAPALVAVGALTQAPWAVPLAAGLSVGSTLLAMRHRH